jgi:hypothetical protein
MAPPANEVCAGSKRGRSAATARRLPADVQAQAAGASRRRPRRYDDDSDDDGSWPPLLRAHASDARASRDVLLGLVGLGVALGGLLFLGLRSLGGQVRAGFNDAADEAGGQVRAGLNDAAGKVSGQVPPA